MKYEKISAGLMTALMLLTTFGSAVLAATSLGSFDSFLGNGAGTPTYLVVVGSGAAASDVAGAIDIATRLAELSYTTVQTSTSAGAAGTEKTDISIGLSSTSDLTTGANAFPSTTLTNTHYSGLWQGTVNFNSNNYKAHEAVLVPNIYMRHDLGTSQINGTEKMMIGTGAAVKYQYVFDQTITALGSTTDKNYTKPLKITMMGQSFQIIGVDSSSVTMLVGSSGTATATQGVSYTTTSGAAWTAYSDLGSNAAWARVLLKDSTGALKDTLIINQADSKDSAVAGLTVKVTAVRALQDGTVAGVDLVIGPTGSVEYQFGATADTSSTSKMRFPGQTDWYITAQMVGSSGGTIGATSAIQVEYRPSAIQYLNPGSVFQLPAGYAEIGFVGYNTNAFANVQVKPAGPITAVNSTGTSVTQSPMYGYEIASTPSSVGSGVLASPNWWSSMYLLFNATYNDAGGNRIHTVAVGYKGADGKIYINDDLSKAWNGTIASVTNAELAYGQLNASTSQSFQAKYKLRYSGVGDVTFGLNITVQTNATANPILSAVMICASGCNANIAAANTNQSTLNLQNKTFWSSDFNANPMQFRLGPNAASADATDFFIATEGTNQTSGAGNQNQDVLGDLGVWYLNSAANGASDIVSMNVPSKSLGVDVYFGKKGAANVTAGTVKQLLPITSAVARLDTEALNSAADKTKDWVSVGGACANQASANALGVTFQKFPDCAQGISQGTALIKVVDNYPATGSQTVVVAGYSAQNTRTAATVLQQYDTLLTGVTSNAVVVTSANAAGITPVTSATTTAATNATK